MPRDAYATRHGPITVHRRGEAVSTCDEPGCHFAAVFSCDHDLGRGIGDDRFCSKALCGKHGAPVGNERHLCFEHAAILPRAEVWTARIGYHGDDGLAVTRFPRIALHQTEGQAIVDAFAPSAAILMPILEIRRAGGEETEEQWEEYAAKYRAEMRASYRNLRGAWEGILARPSCTLLCFCTCPERCHRSLLATFFGKLGATVRGERPAPEKAQMHLALEDA